MDLDKAVQAHVGWKMKFRSAIAKHEHLDAATILKDDCCEIGKWLHGTGKMAMGSTAEFGKALTAHKTFHVEAGKIAQLINAKKYDEAEKQLGAGTKYTHASSSVSSALMALKKAMG